MRPLKFKFEVPVMQGVYYDPRTKTCYFFTPNMTKNEREEFAGEIEQALVHETLHYVIHKITDKKTQYKFDNIARKILNWDEKVYNMLY